MNLHSILLPVFVQVLLTFVLLLLTGARRFAAVRAGQVEAADVSMGEKGWPAPAQAAANAFGNQFELPVLFFALVPLAISTRSADATFVALSWVFVLARIAQALVYVTINRVPLRFAAFFVGVGALGAMWVIFALRILSAPLPA